MLWAAECICVCPSTKDQISIQAQHLIWTLIKSPAAIKPTSQAYGFSLSPSTIASRFPSTDTSTLDVYQTRKSNCNICFLFSPDVHVIHLLATVYRKSSEKFNRFKSTNYDVEQKTMSDLYQNHISICLLGRKKKKRQGTSFILSSSILGLQRG